MRKKLTQTQKARRGVNRAKFKKLHHDYITKGNKAVDNGQMYAASEYFNKANEFWNKYIENGGRDK